MSKKFLQEPRRLRHGGGDTGGPLKAPVAKGILSRMFDGSGNAIDREPTLTDVQWHSVHRAPPPLARRSTKSEIFESGIKVIDVLVPLERGGTAGLFGGAGVGAYLESYVEPTFNIFSEISCTLTLAVRLFGNMMSGAMIISGFAGLVFHSPSSGRVSPHCELECAPR